MQDEANQIFGPYVKWHYSRGVKELFNLLENLQRFIYHFFSIKLLLRTLLSPWRRLHENYDKADIGRVASSFLVNSIMRVVGAVSRLIIIIIGLTASVALAIASIILVAAWLTLPIFILAIISGGIVLIKSAL